MKTTITPLFTALCLTALVWLGVATSSHATAVDDAAPQTVTLTGNTSYDGWSNAGLTAGSNPGFPGFFTSTTAWPNAIGSNVAGSGDATLNKTANGAGGGPYPASGSLYFASFGDVPNTFGGSLAVTEATPLAELKTIVFQLEIGEAWTYDLYNHTLPTLTYTYNDGTGDVTVSSVVADFSSVLVKADNGTVEMPSGTETVYINLYAMQWDLSAVNGEITNFSIEFSGVEHAQVYAMQLDQGDTMVQVVPEPSTYAMIVAGCAMLLWRMRRREALAI